MPSHYVIVNADGYITGAGFADTPPDGAVAVDTLPATGALFSRRHRLVDGRCVATEETWLPAPTVRLARARAYPTVGDQLDVLWKALGPLLEHPEAVEMLERLAAVKRAHPKGSN